MGKFTGVLLCSDYDNTIVDTAAVMRGEIEEALPGEKTIPMNAPAVLYNGAALYDFRCGKVEENIIFTSLNAQTHYCLLYHRSARCAKRVLCCLVNLLQFCKQIIL